MNDLWTMMWKELKDLLFQGGWKASIRPLLLIGIMGIYLPLQFGLQWLALSPIELFVILWIPFSVIISFIGDAIAGERERHTLETLLASRISDRAILLGKVVVTVGYAWGMALGGLLLGLILVNLFRGNGGGWMFYHPFDLFLEALALSLLTCLLGASAGVLVSLRTSTVRQAQQILGIGTFVLVFGGDFCLASIACEFCRVVNLLAVFAPCHGRDRRAGCDLAGSLAGEFPTLTLDCELRGTRPEQTPFLAWCAGHGARILPMVMVVLPTRRVHFPFSSHVHDSGGSCTSKRRERCRAS